MLAQEARVWLVEDDARKQASITEVVEAVGGQVVGLTVEEGPAYGILKDETFPANIGGANVVILDNELEMRGRPSGDHIFVTGYRSGLMHGVKHGANIGLLAIGGSRDLRSEVSISTGANFYPSREEDAAAAWVTLLDGQPAEPYIPNEGVIERLEWQGGLAETFDYALRLSESNGGVLVLGTTSSEQLHVGENVEDIQGDPDLILAGKELAPASQDGLSPLIEVMSRKIYDQEDTNDKFVFAHSSQAVIATDSSILVVKHTLKRNLRREYSWDRAFWDSASLDVISLDRLAEIPSAYWDEVGVVPPFGG